MIFSSVIFLFVFLPLQLITYFLIPKKYIRTKNILLLLFSLIFYAYGEPKNYWIMLVSITTNFLFGICVNKSKEKNKFAIAKFYLIIAVIFNIGLLSYYKYTMFILNNIYNLFGMGYSVKTIIMPLGISFFTFHGLSYVFDIYYGNAKIQKNIFNVALYISLFPQLVAGPIVRYQTVANEINNRNENISEVALGLRRFMIGLGKKMILANSMGQIADAIFSTPVANLSVFTAWLAPISYALQIYFDFSGYSDMAIGLGRVFGFHFLENFNYPYISKSITEFWRRWHISLGTWFRDYVYIPLGGNKTSVLIHLRNIFIVWTLTGIWHGAAWKFLAWGLFFAIMLSFEKYVLLKYLQKLWAPLQHCYALILILFGWVLFRSHNIGYAIDLFKALFFTGGNPIFDNQFLYYIIQYKFEIIIAILASIPIKNLFTNAKYEIPKYIFSFVGFLISVVYILTTTFNPFIYFRF